jgi:hypothetical protein
MLWGCLHSGPAGKPYNSLHSGWNFSSGWEFSIYAVMWINIQTCNFLNHSWTESSLVDEQKSMVKPQTISYVYNNFASNFASNVMKISLFLESPEIGAHYHWNSSEKRIVFIFHWWRVRLNRPKQILHAIVRNAHTICACIQTLHVFRSSCVASPNKFLHHMEPYCFFKLQCISKGLMHQYNKHCTEWPFLNSLLWCINYIVLHYLLHYISNRAIEQWCESIQNALKITSCMLQRSIFIILHFIRRIKTRAVVRLFPAGH